MFDFLCAGQRGVRPRIAVAFFGLPRSSGLCFPSIQRQFLEPLNAIGEVRAFHHLYHQQSIENPRSGEAGILTQENYAPFESFEGEFELPGQALHRWSYAEILKHGDRYCDNGRSLANLVHQLHSLHKVTSMIVPWSPDAVVFLRPDLLYHDPVDLAVVQKCLKDPRAVYLPWWQPWGGRNDRFAVCGARAYLPYGKRVEHAREYCVSKGLSLHAEELLEFALNRDAMRIRTVGWRASRVRLGGVVYEESFEQPYDPRLSARLLRLAVKVIKRVRAVL